MDNINKEQLDSLNWNLSQLVMVLDKTNKLIERFFDLRKACKRKPLPLGLG
jgi:hypothetical protein